MTTMYRVLRPFIYNRTRKELQRDSRGGIVFRLESTHEHEFWFTVSQCDRGTRFSMEVATQICDERADLVRDNDPHFNHGRFALESWDEMQHLLLDWCAKYEPRNDTPTELYRAHELHSIAAFGKSIIEHNERQAASRNIDLKAIENEQIKGMYAAIDNLKG